VSQFLEKLKANAEWYEANKGLAENRVKFVRSGYAHAIYSVVLDDQTRPLTDHDLVVLCDRGNACFGGSVRRGINTATVEVYTD